jgi:DNA-directed RNA polymerase specialized sigma24 family protein
MHHRKYATTRQASDSTLTEEQKLELFENLKVCAASVAKTWPVIDSDEQRDLAGIGFLQAMRGMKAYRGKNGLSLMAWCQMIGRRAMVAHAFRLNRQRARLYGIEGGPEPMAEEEPEADLMSVPTWLAFAACKQEIDNQIVTFIRQGYGPTEIAQMLKLSRTAVWRRRRSIARRAQKIAEEKQIQTK